MSLCSSVNIRKVRYRNTTILIKGPIEQILLMANNNFRGAVPGVAKKSVCIKILNIKYYYIIKNMYLFEITRKLFH